MPKVSNEKNEAERPNIVKKNNLIGGPSDNIDVHKSDFHGHLKGDQVSDHIHSNAQAGKPGILPPVQLDRPHHKKEFKPADVREQDFEGM